MRLTTTPTLAPTGLLASTLYYIYAYLNGTTITLEASPTVPGLSNDGTGFVIKSGDDTRLLVGMAYTTSGISFLDHSTTRLVRTWFNDPGVSAVTAYNVSAGGSSAAWTSPSVVDSQVLTWPGESVLVRHQGTVEGSGVVTSAISTDPFTATTAGIIRQYLQNGAAEPQSIHYQTIITPTVQLNTYYHLFKTVGGSVTFVGSTEEGRFQQFVTTILRDTNF